VLVLGLNHSNDSAAALVRDGVVIAASRQERFSRIKHDSSFPNLAIDFCLKTAGVTLADVDVVAFFWNPAIHASTPNRRMTGAWRHHLEFLHSVPGQLLPMLTGGGTAGPPPYLEQRIPMPGRGKPHKNKTLRIVYVTHHLCHAASVLFRSPFSDCAILTVDGYGERNSTFIGHGSGLDIEELAAVDFPHSIGSLYAAFTQFLGFRANNGEGKVMGLASYGEPSVYLDRARDLVELTDDGFRLDLDAFAFFHEHGPRFSPRFTGLFGPARGRESTLDKRHFDVAYAVQKVTEEALLHLAKLTRERTGSPRLGMAGGVVLNCVANGRIMREAGFDKCFFQPAADDAGTSMGAALWVSHCLEKQPRPDAVSATDYLGLRYSDAEVVAELDKAGVAYRTSDDAPAEAAQALADGRIIGWFQGAAEFGPRALGNRSIVADPRNAENKDTLNARVKFREPFRPFAPSCLESAVGDLFDSDVPSPYMLRVYDTRPERLEDLGAVTHVDGGARVQTVNADQNPRYHALIKRFGELTGVPCVLNTSFNIRGEPIVNSVADALKCFFTTDMDVLFVHDLVVEKAGR